MSIRTLIVDDEPLARERIRDLLIEEAEMEVVGEAWNGEEAVSAILELQPDLVFLDIQMPRLDGFGVLERIGPGRMPPTVFVTAFDEFAVRAFEAHALDYLLKPFTIERFASTLARVRRARGSGLDNSLEQRLRDLLSGIDGPAKTYRQRFIIRSGPKLRFIAPDEVNWIAAEGNYVRLHTGKQSHLLRTSMGQLQDELDPKMFVRIHRSTIVNIRRIRELESVFQGEYVLRLEDGTKLSSSRAFRTQLETAMNIS